MTNEKIHKIIAVKLGISLKQVANTVALLNEGATIPFIARYRKEVTENLDEVAIANIKTENERLDELEKRKITILKTIEEQQLLTPELNEKINNCFDTNELEDIYLPFKPKRRTKATIAREKGLEPLAKIIMAQLENNLENRAAKFITNQVANTNDAMAGARDIIAEWINENSTARNIVRNVYTRESNISSKVVKGKEEDGAKYNDYFESSEQLRRCPSHRFLAMQRGENEGFLKISIATNEENVIEKLTRYFVKSNNECGNQVAMAVKDSYKRLLAPSIETEFFALTKATADSEAIRVFAENLRQLFLAPPLGQKRVLALDPGFRTGCKVVCLDAQGNLLHNETIYPHAPQNEVSQSMRKLSGMIETYKIEAIAIGDGTASRETENFIKKMRFDRELQIFMVSEDGASVYSASKTARDEFPQFDVTVRGAVSIGRRLMDPLAELVKIEPKAIGVGQYQHDVDQKQLQQSLETVIESCVNSVGVDLNTASSHLLNYVSGLGPILAQNIIEYRKQNGAFSSRNELKKVPRMGAKSFEQCAGFLRIRDGENVLDNSAVHPERYNLVEKIAKDNKCTVANLIGKDNLKSEINLNNYITDDVGLLTLNDIFLELAKPGRDPRSGIKVFEFANNIFSVKDLQIGMILPGIITNITRFGVFVDVGVKQDGLVHISEIANRFIKDPAEVVKLHQHVKVRVLEVDIPRKRIAFSIKQAE